ncbi:hypothetical protein GM3708_3570 (plasmid) [Geminocystis sp. NIES-3708]|uniref:hypothetical protein n=1 Tax=Geminocystis sp. NIES-3708 TaxID=1615909 RepID=UPI0005FC4F0D|nr:hypothetical protein [Geminocystis sp. NIES-3708]BAQ63164.1 hypothetical protein GM3708_3570 [Geminocystis sp. NIES-3708]
MSMESDLQELVITKGELRHLTGFDSFRFSLIIYFTILVVLIETSVAERPRELNASIQAFGDRKISTILESIFKIILSIVQSLKLTDFIRKKAKNSLTNLLIDVKNHNKIVYKINVMDQLKSVGNQVDLNDRKNVLKALKITRENLVKALKTNRILRENPGFEADSFSVDITSIQSLQISEQSSEYAALFNQALQIGISIQEDIDNGLLE